MLKIVDGQNLPEKINTENDVVDGRIYRCKWGTIYICNKFQNIALFSVSGQYVIEKEFIRSYDLQEINATLTID